jgi:hypothetical protein
VFYCPTRWETASPTQMCYIVYVPLTGKYETDNWVFKLTVPYIVVTRPGNVVRDIGILGRYRLD